jgi:hypothetical protein
VSGEECDCLLSDPAAALSFLLAALGQVSLFYLKERK